MNGSHRVRGLRLLGLLLLVCMLWLLAGCGSAAPPLPPTDPSPTPGSPAAVTLALEEAATPTGPPPGAVSTSAPGSASPTPDSVPTQPGSEVTVGEVASGTIAYVRADTQDEIRLVAQDGSNDQLLWAHGVDDPGIFGTPAGVHNIMGLSWRPGGGQLAFVSTHEQGCSMNRSDLFVIDIADATVRRVTQSPACVDLADYPQGSVRIPVQNLHGSQFEALLYIQGAPAAQPISVAPNGNAVITFESVADLGEGVMQRAILMLTTDSDDRDFGEETAVDVQGGSVVETAPLQLDFPNLTPRVIRSPTWRHDGTRLGYAFNYASLHRIEPNPPPLQQGELLVAASTYGLLGQLEYADHLLWGPTAERAGDLLYRGEEGLESGIYLATEDSDSPGTQIVRIDPIVEEVQGLAWLPDGSGFVYALLESSGGPVSDHANLYLYRFASGEVTALTSFGPNDYAGRLSISPDGARVVLERSTSWSFLTGELTDPGLWTVALDGTDMQLLVENGRAPAWGP